jgi:hypothetical protein
MSFITERKREILRRRHRKMKLAKLREKYAAASGKVDKEKIAAKIRRISFYVETPGGK